MVFTVFRLLTDFVCLYNYEFWLSLCKIVRSSIILLLPLFKWNFCLSFAAQILRVTSLFCPIALTVDKKLYIHNNYKMHTLPWVCSLFMTVNKTFIVRNQRLYFFGQLIEKPPFPPKILNKTEVVIIWTEVCLLKSKQTYCQLLWI